MTRSHAWRAGGARILEEYEALASELRHKPRAEKVIEATVPGGTEFKEIRVLPSAFEYYPQVEHEASSLKEAGQVDEAIAVLRALKDFLLSGDVSKFPNKKLVCATQPGEVVDLTEDDDEASNTEAVYLWQVDCGDDGWKPFPADANQAVEAAFVLKQRTCSFTGFGGNSYVVNFEFLSQQNTSTGMFRPVRRVKVL